MTLIELMIVILILGILSAIVVLGVGAFQNTGDNQACIASGRSIETAAAASYAKTGSYANWGDYLKNGTSNKWGLAPDGTGNVNTASPPCPAP